METRAYESLAAVDQALLVAARTARDAAYAPYSGFAVGAAIRCADGRVFAGCNVESASYGLTCCAERVALFAAVAAGAREFAALGVVAAAAGRLPSTPCGACRQVLAEFPPSFPVLLTSDIPTGAVLLTSVHELLPRPFTLRTGE